MLLCGIINELRSSTKLPGQEAGTLLSYFFCQATDPRIDNATAVLRGLIYLLLIQQPSLISHLREHYHHAGEHLFKDVNAWVALSKIFANILQDSSLGGAYLVVDALDECDKKDLPKLLDFIVQNSSSSSRVKWLVSSRNELDIEQKLLSDRSRARLSLELNAEYVSQAIDAYIRHRVPELSSIRNDEELQALVRDAMRRKANGTFLWVSLVVQELKAAESWEVEQIVDEMPTGLKEVYDRMFKQIQQLKRESPELCRLLLSTATTAYRPLRLEELGILSGLPKQILDKPQSVERIVLLCGSFLTIRGGIVYFIHQSAKDFLSNDASRDIFPRGVGNVHYNIFSRSLQIMSKVLRRDIYGLVAPGFPIDQVNQPSPDPLAAARYSCIYWVDHLSDWDSYESVTYRDLQKVDSFLRQNFLHWLEALSLLRGVSNGILSMAKLEGLLQVRLTSDAL